MRAAIREGDSRLSHPGSFGSDCRLYSTELASHINLCEFPALTHFETGLSTYKSLSTTLPTVNRLEELTLNVETDVLDEGIEPEWDPIFDEGIETEVEPKPDPCAEMDDLIVSASMPALRRVEIRVFGTSNDTPWFHLGAIKYFFPQLQARGLLAVSDVRGA